MRGKFIVVFLVLCLGSSLVFGVESKSKGDDSTSPKRAVGIWVADKEKMQQDSDKLLKLAKAKADEWQIKSPDEQLKKLQALHKQQLEGSAMLLWHFNEDGSGGVFQNIAGMKGVRSNLSGALYLLQWKEQGNKLNITIYSAYGMSKAVEMESFFEGDSLTSQAENTNKKLKANEKNLQIQFALEKSYSRKVSPGDKTVQKAKVLVPKEVQIETPKGFGKSKRDHFNFEYCNLSDRLENFVLSFNPAYEIAIYNRPGEKKATHDDVIAILRDDWLKKCMKNNPQAKLTTGFEMLDGTKAAYAEGLIDKNVKHMKGPLYGKIYFLIDDGIIMLNITLSAKSSEKIKFMDDYVKKIKLNMTKTWAVTMEQVLEAKRKSEEYMKKKNVLGIE